MRRARQGLTLIEIIVVIAIVGLFLAISIPAATNAMMVQQTAAAKELAQTYRFLVDEAAMQNVTFRIAYDLDTRSYEIEVGDPNTLIFTDPDKRLEAEAELIDKMSQYTERELEEVDPENEELTELLEKRFSGLDNPAFNDKVEMPGNTYIAWVYTPQYGEPVEPGVDFSEPEDTWALEEGQEHTVVYSYIFPNGVTEHTLIRIATVDDPDDGFTIEVEPLSGRVVLHDEILLPEDSLDWLPDEAPELDL
jgi:prepilin-type N-terminal cleavage/methylation domain-containing protein